MMDPLNTDSTAADQTRRFIPGKEPLGKLDSVRVALLDSGLGIQVAPNREVFIEVPSILEAKLINVEANNPRLSILWRQVETSDDSTLNRALISNPTSLRTEVQFFTEGVYHFEVSATLGLIEKRDTLLISVRHAPPPPRPRVIQPRPNDSLPTGKPTNIVWEMPIRGPVSIRFSPNGGGKWMPVVEHFIHPDSLQIFNWIPPVDAAGTTNCVIEVRLDADTLMVAHSVGPFTLLPK
jgi:hypothetical protein